MWPPAVDGLFQSRQVNVFLGIIISSFPVPASTSHNVQCILQKRMSLSVVGLSFFNLRKITFDIYCSFHAVAYSKLA